LSRSANCLILLFMSTCGKTEVSVYGGFCLLSTTHGSLKNEKYMRVIVRVEGHTSIAKVLRTIGASKPFAVDSRHTAVA
jgi:hypothetical protein